MVSSCGYRAWVTNDDKTNSLIYYIDDDGRSSKVSHDIKEEILEYLRAKYNEDFVLYDFSYNQCSNQLKEDWINNCDYGIMAYPTSNKNDIFFIEYEEYKGITDNYK